MKLGKIIIVALLSFVFIGCGRTASSSQNLDKDSSPTAGAKASEIEDENYPTLESESSLLADTSVDIDLTVMSPTMIYAEVLNMMMEPIEYENKAVKMQGVCGTYRDEKTDKIYYACIIQDATQCCSQGLEFVLDENQYSESDYPAEGEQITVKGTFSTYEENGGTYLTMKDAVLVAD